MERIVWPHVKTLLLQKLKGIQEELIASNQHHENQTGVDIVVVEAAVLLDAEWDRQGLFDAIWIIRASEDTSVERLVNKRGMDKNDALKRLKAQVSRRGIGNWEEELNDGAVTAVIENEGCDLWDEMKKCFDDPKCWKEQRCPQKSIEDA